VRVGWLGTAPAPGSAVTVATIDSLPVRDLVQEVLVESDNNTAEGLLQGIGRLVLGTDGSVAAGAAAVQSFLATAGLGDAGAVGVDGSGLSRENRTTCNQLQRLLDAWGPGSALAGSLAVACRTGTLERYLCQSPAAGVLRAKTGTLGVSRALSGYLTSLTGRRVAFSFVVNGPNAPAVGTAAWGPLLQALSLL
jgi:serine-type D-Ala-D-Ala carboxypeptidase/endopeptidase (penicillin-binding protein 4)